MLSQYSDSFEKAVLANTNAGGENCHRGAALGALMGASLGESGIPPRLIEVRCLNGQLAQLLLLHRSELGFAALIWNRGGVHPNPTSNKSSVPASLLQGLHDSAAIRKEINDFCDAVYPATKNEL